MVQVHQHFFCCRLDLAVDDNRGGQGLTVSEVTASLSPICSAAAPSMSLRFAPAVVAMEVDPRISVCSAAVQVNCETMPLGPDNPYGEWLAPAALALWCSGCAHPKLSLPPDDRAMASS